MFSQPALHECESDNQSDQPEPEQHNQRQRPKVAEKIFAPRRLPDVQSNPGPKIPRVAIEERSQPKSALHPPRQDDRFKRIQQDGKDDARADNRRPYMHRLEFR